MKNIIKIVIVFAVLTFLTILVGNKTFLSNSYYVNNSAGERIKIPIPYFSYYIDTTKNENIFYTLRSTNNIRSILGKYVESLEACYDESYFYDSDLDITIFKYYVEDGKFFNKIYLSYQLGNYCKDEYVLDKNWITEFQDNAIVSEIKEEICEISTCREKDINKVNLDNLLNYVKQIKRVEFSENTNIDTKYVGRVYYTLNKKSYVLSIFEYKEYLGFKVVDQNDHSKNAIYEMDDQVTELLSQMFEK